MEMKSFSSSNLNSGQYDDKKKELIINFNDGASYRYTGVPEAVWNSLKDAGSAGGYFHANIRTSYSYSRI